MTLRCKSFRVGATWILPSILALACGLFSGDDNEDEADSASMPMNERPSPCSRYCFNVMTCANGVTVDQQHFDSQSQCASHCESLVRREGGCGNAAYAYFECAASFDDCDDYVVDHDAVCDAEADSFKGWCAQ